jgi:hypothetical protein
VTSDPATLLRFFFVWELNEDHRQVTAYRAFSNREEQTAVAQEARTTGGLTV